VSDAGPVVATGVPDTHVGSEYSQAPTAADDLFNAGLVWGVERVHAPEAWARGVTGSHNTVVAIIDTGIASNHPDLAPNIVHMDCFVSTGSQASGDCLAYPSLSDHGTHVAGTVAAAFGGGRVVGVGPNLGLAGYNTFELIAGCGVCTYSDVR
jgi:lantibiotic leader peptide-processing serine protease